MEEVAPAPEPHSRFPFVSLIAGIPCAALPFLLCGYGYGAYLRIGWFMIIPALMGSGAMALYVFRALRNLIRGPHNRLPIRSKQDGVLALAFLGLTILSWVSGKQVRSWHCETICARAAPALEALRKYQAGHTHYPFKLQDVPDFNRLAEAGRVSIREGGYCRDGWDVGRLDDADMTIYLGSGNSCCVVPLERKLLMSITRFYILRKDLDSAGWTEDHIIWTWSSIGRRL